MHLDDYEKIRDVPGVITKIDTEGADFIALNGMSKLLSDRLCTVQLEFTPSLISEYEDPVRRLYELSKDFLILEVSSNHRLPVLSDIDWITDFVSAVGRRQSSITDIMIISKKIPKAIDLFSRILVG